MFLVVGFSVVVQGGSIPWAARRLGVPMRLVEPEPWNISIGLRAEPRGLQRFVVAAGSRADGEEIRELPIGDHAWLSMVVRDGAARQARGSLVLVAGDEVLVLGESEDEQALRRVFEERHPAPVRAADP